MPEETEIVTVLSDSEKEYLVETIVKEWNDIVNTMQNTTIRLCLKIKEILKDHPQETVKDILRMVSEHPNIKKFVSIDRIWQGMRLVKNRPDLIDYVERTEEEREALDFKNKPYLKKDGEVFWEFYFELEKAPIGDMRRQMLEVDGKENLWSFRELRRNIQDVKDELASPNGEIQARKRAKIELLKQTMAILRTLSVEKLSLALTSLREIQSQEE